MLAYPGWMRGVVDFTWTSLCLNHPEDLTDPGRERAFFNENPYTAVGFHNGHIEPPASLVANIQFPPPNRPVLLFAGSLDKLSPQTVYMLCRILAATGNGPNSALLAVTCSSDLGVDSVRLWMDEYNMTVGSNETVAASRLFLYPYRTKELFWCFLRGLRNQCLSISTLSHYDVHTLVGDMLARCVCHLTLKCKDLLWQRRVAALLVQGVGLGQFLIANDYADLEQRAIWWLLNPRMLRAAVEHMAKQQEEKLGYYNQDRMVSDLEAGILLAYEQVVDANGDSSKLRDIDFTKLKERPPPCREFMPPFMAPGLILGESCAMQFDRLMNQIDARKLSFKGFGMLFQYAVSLHHSLGFRGMRLDGFGSSVLCVWMVYRGEYKPGIADGQEAALKVNHFTKCRPRQENRMVNDSIVRANHVFASVGARPGPHVRDMLPAPLPVYPRGCAAGFVQAKHCWKSAGTKGVKSANKAVRSRTVLCFGVSEFVREGSMYGSALVKWVVAQYREKGIIHEKMSRVIQALVFSVLEMSRRNIFCLDISFGNVAIREKEKDGRISAVWLDTGGGVVIPRQDQDGAARIMMRSSTTVAAGPDAGPAGTLKTPPLSVNKETGIGFLDASVIRKMFNKEGSISLTVAGTPTIRSEGMVAKFNASGNRGKPLTTADASCFDLTSAMLCSVQLLRPAPRSPDGRAQWARELATAIGSRDAMREFLREGAAVAVQQEHLLDAFADMFWRSLRKGERSTALEVLVTEALSCKIWSHSNLQALQGDGIPVKGGASRCPPGSQWHEQKRVLPDLTLKLERDRRSAKFIGAGALTTVGIKKGELIGIYAGTEGSPDGFAPCRYTTYAMDNGLRRHCVAEQPVDWFLERGIVGPFLNGVVGDEPTNVELRRTEFWVDSDGVLYIAMYASRDIAPGEFLRWHYNPFAGGGGRDSYTFPAD
jgi:hypothetical protein